MPIHFLIRRIYSITGVVPLFLFILIHVLCLNLLYLGSKDMVQAFIAVQGHTVILVLDLMLVVLPLLFHLIYSLVLMYHTQVNIHQYRHAGNFRHVAQKIAAFAVLLFLFFHFYELIETFRQGAAGYRYFRDILTAHQSRTGIVLYWLALVAAVYFFSQALWLFLIDWGVTAGRRSQRFALGVISIGFVFVAGALVVAGGLQLFS